VLMGGIDFFSNGIHLNVIEAADDPAMESWANLQAIDDVVLDVIETDSHLVVSALTGDAAAGGVPFALAADYVLAREDVVLNPYYGHMGGLYGARSGTTRSVARRSTELSGSATSSAPAISSFPRRAHSRSPDTSSTSRSCTRRCTRRRSPGGRSARSPMRSTMVSATCTSTSTTAR